MKVRRLFIATSLCLNLVAAAGCGCLAHKGGGAGSLPVKSGLVKESAVLKSSTDQPTEDHGFFRLSSQLKECSIRVLTVEGCPGFVILPLNETPKPTQWIWTSPTLLPKFPDTFCAWMFNTFLHRGIAIAGIDVGES